MNAQFFESKHTVAMPYEEYLDTDPEKALAWRRVYDQVHLTDDQQRLLGAFTRTMRVLCISGIWCGDCAQQGPLLQRIAEAGPCIDLRWVDRDQHLDLGKIVAINAGLRVPMVVFLAEDFEPVSVMGDRTLTRYRALASRNLGPSCPLPGAPLPDHELAETLQDWLDEFERVHLLLRLSGRLRTLHND